jgi:DNA polymerase-4
MKRCPTEDRWIAHVDLDAFFASCEQRDHPEYRGRPLVVGALPGHRGVVAAASYEARRFGIHSAMPVSEASRRCPHAVFVLPDAEKYRRISRQIFGILGGITPVVEVASIDEAYLDVSGLDRLFGPPEAIGLEIKRRILAGTRLTASVGMGPNRLIAKLGSAYRKPDGLTIVPPHEVGAFLAPMPVTNLRGVGRRAGNILTRLGIRTVGEVRTVPPAVLEQRLGKKAAASIRGQAFGIASDEVVPQHRRKGISKETTFESDVTDTALLHDALRRLAAEVAATARREALCGSVVTLKVRFRGFETHTRQRRLDAATHDERVILKTARQLLHDGTLPQRPVRLVGVGISAWMEAQTAQADLFAQPEREAKDRRLLMTIDSVTERFGEGKLQVGISRKAGVKDSGA